MTKSVLWIRIEPRITASPASFRLGTEARTGPVRSTLCLFNQTTRPDRGSKQTFEVEGGTKVVKAGEMIHMPPNTAHYGRNATDKNWKSLVIRIKDKEKPIMVEVKR